MDNEYITIARELKKDFRELRIIIEKLFEEFDEQYDTNEFDDLFKEMEEIK